MVVPGPVSRGEWCFTGLLFPGAKDGQAANVAAVDKFSVVLVALFAFIFLHERLSLREWLSVFLLGSGVMLFSLKIKGRPDRIK